MARNWKISRWRRAMMQAVMWLILGATVGLAALVGRNRGENGQVRLSDRTYSLGAIEVRLPRGWKVWPVIRTASGASLLKAVEPQRRPGAGEDVMDTVRREMMISTEPLPEAETVPSYLNRMIGGPAGGESRDGQRFEAMEVAGNPGRFVKVQPLDALEGQPVLGWSMYACTVLPSRVAVIIRLEGVGQAMPADRDTVALVAKGAAVVDEPGSN